MLEKFKNITCWDLTDALIKDVIRPIGEEIGKYLNCNDCGEGVKTATEYFDSLKKDKKGDAKIAEDIGEKKYRFNSKATSAVKKLSYLSVIVTAPGNEVDFVSRNFAPKLGIPEDPVTGSAHCELIPYWSRVLKKKRMIANQISKRGGKIYCKDLNNRVTIGGEAVTFLRGEIEINL